MNGRTAKKLRALANVALDGLPNKDIIHGVHLLKRVDRGSIIHHPRSARGIYQRLKRELKKRRAA